MRPAKLSCILLLLAGGVLLHSASAQTATTSSTPAPEVTPVPAAGTLVRVSYLIDGVVFVMQCNFTGMNMSNCSFETDHGLTVTLLSGTTEIPLYMTALVIATLVLVVALLVMAIYTVVGLRSGGTSGGYQEVPQPQYAPQPEYAQYPPPTRAFGAPAGGKPKIIEINLVQPSMP
jgi:hypothetical protein